MRNIALAAAAIAVATAGHAYAGSEQEVSGPSRPIYASIPTQIGGSQAYQDFGGRTFTTQSNAPVNSAGSAAYQDFAGRSLQSDSPNRAFAAAPQSPAAPSPYRFEVVGQPWQNGGIGKMHQVDSQSIVRIRLVRASDGVLAKDAVLTKVGADMSPDGMPEMAARVSILSSDDGVYRLVVHPDMAGDWAVRLAARAPGEAREIQGSVVARLAK
jgi:hypothetical protein